MAERNFRSVRRIGSLAMTPKPDNRPPNCQIRPAAAVDIPAMTGLWREFMAFHARFDPYFTTRPDGHRTWARFAEGNLQNPDWLVLVATRNGQMAGYAMARTVVLPPVFTTERYGFIQDLAVTAACRRRGIGSALFRAAQAWFQERGIDRIELDMASRNPLAGPFWRKMGFGSHLERLVKLLPSD